jgi:hypothetical protein
MKDTRNVKRKARIEFDFKPYDLQQEIIDHIDGKFLNKQGERYRFFIAVFGRQAGKSWLAKYVLLDHAVNRDETCMWVAPSIPTARGHWNDLVQLIQDSGMIEAGIVTKLSQASKEIHFADGGSISVRSAIEPDNLRGASLDLLILDEAAFFRDGAYVWWSVCMPMITATGGTVLFTTTPNGRNWLYELFKMGQLEDSRFYKSWTAPSTVSPYQDKELLEDTKLHMPSLQWREEYMAEFLADGGGVFAGVEAAASIDMLGMPHVDADLERYVAGMDIGFNNDFTCFTVIDTVRREQVYGERFTNIGTVRTLKRIIELLDLWQPKVTHIEQNGVGLYLIDLLKAVVSGRDIEDLLGVINEVVEEDGLEDESRLEDVGKHKIKTIHMDNTTKRELVERLAADIEYKRFKLLSEKNPYGVTQISEMSTYERVPTASGMQITYQAAEGSHDDTIAALYVAYKGVKKLARQDIMDMAKSKAAKREHRSSPFRSRSVAGRRHRR